VSAANTKYLIVIGGPTASGKTAMAIELARAFSTEIVSADSRQFYREMRIGTARPTEAELAQARHHFIADRSVTEPLSAGAFEREALVVLDRIFAEHPVAILVGGSGLYLRAVTEGLDEFPTVPPAITAELEQLYARAGLPALQQELAERDPDYYAEVDRQNHRRLLRALAICRASGRPYSSFRRQAPADRSFTPLFLYPDWPRAALYARIDARVDAMFAAGLVAEARRLYPWRTYKALQTVGYQELFAYFAGETDLETARALIKRNTRRYAKRQLTWLRRDGYWHGIPPGTSPEAWVRTQIEGA
jgi:tRNA dimethylallyltransferase